MLHLILAAALVLLFTANAIAVIFAIDKPRKPVTRGDAVAVLVINATIIAYLLSL